ncbi:MAG TPA: TetR/AcrR family transcriptional regulator [Microbacterium sp.]|nr:TetR/AcrR family transcriptional regulator [Microbacterium sp.]
MPGGQPYHHGNLQEALVAAGLELTRSGGERALVMRDVTGRVGVSANAAYRHFADRDALLEAIADRIRHGMADRMHALEPADRSPRALLRAVGLGYIGFALTEPGWFEVAFSTIQARPDAAGEASLPPPLLLLVAALDALAATGELAVREGAEWPCWSAVHGFALLALHGPLRALAPDELWAAAERTVDDVITGLLARALVA